MLDLRISHFLTAYYFSMFLWYTTNSSDTYGDKGAQCKTLFTFGYGYRQFFHVSAGSERRTSEDVLDMKFMVKARSDAHILLSPSPSPEEADPVYEVVLGAGKNSFSDIRRRRRAATKASAFTKDILSFTEMKGFWIRMTGDGMILVGSEGEELPFMEWQDPEPLRVEYFSFCTWSGVAGKWYYDCADTDDLGSEAVAVPATLTTTQRLRDTVLTNYDVYAPPVSRSYMPVQISVQLQTNQIHLDVTKAVLTVGSVLILEWFDDRVTWNPKNFSNLTVLTMIHQEVWQPEVIHFNGIGKDVSVAGQEGMRVTSEGLVRWSPRGRLQSRCEVELRHWPWDTQTCGVQLGLWNQPENIQLVPKELKEAEPQQIISSEWRVMSLVAHAGALKRPWLTELTPESVSNSSITFTFTLKRVNAGVFYIFVIPLLVVMVMSLICFWMEPLGLEKIATNCLLVVLLCGFLLSLESNLATSSTHTPYLLKAYMHVLTASACAVVVSVLVRGLGHHWSRSHLSKTLTCGLTVTLFCLPDLRQRKPKYGELIDDEADEEYRSGLLLATLCDRVAFMLTVVVYTAVLFI